MGVAERKAADNAMATRMKQLGIVRRVSRCCICQKLIPTGADKNTLPDVTKHLLFQCAGPAPR